MALQTKDPSPAVISTVAGSATGGPTSSTMPVITGTADAGNIIAIYDGVRLIGSTTVAANGTWSFTPTTALKAGNHNFAAIPTDSQGNHGASSNVVTAAIGSTAPATPGTPTVTDDTGHTIPAGGTTADSTPTFAGTGTAGDTITVYDNGTEIGSTTIPADGNWSWTPSAPLPAGDNSIVIIETNPAGTPSSARARMTSSPPRRMRQEDRARHRRTGSLRSDPVLFGPRRQRPLSPMTTARPFP